MAESINFFAAKLLYHVEYKTVIRELIQRVLRRAHAEQIPFLAAAVSYYALLSVFPLVLLALVVLSTLNQEGYVVIVADFVANYLSPELRPIIDDLATDTRGGRGVVALVGVVFLVWSSLRIFMGLDMAFDRIYGSRRQERFTDKLLDAGAALLSVGLTVVLSVAWGNVLGWYSGPGSSIVGSVFLVIALAAALLPLYILLPDASVDLRNTVPGVVFAAGSIGILRFLWDAYVAYFKVYGAYGVIGGFLLLATWLYLSAIAVLMGAILNSEINHV